MTAMFYLQLLISLGIRLKSAEAQIQSSTIILCGRAEDPCKNVSLYTDLVATWRDANEHCQRMHPGGRLVTILDSTTQESLEQILSDKVGHGYWTGGRVNFRDNWIWVDNKSYAVDTNRLRFRNNEVNGSYATVRRLVTGTTDDLVMDAVPRYADLQALCEHVNFSAAPHGNRRSASIGGSVVLECGTGDYPPEQSRTSTERILTLSKRDHEVPIFIQLEGYPPHVDEGYQGRIRLVETASIEISDLRAADEGWYECWVVHLHSTDDNLVNASSVYLAVYARDRSQRFRMLPSVSDWADARRKCNEQLHGDLAVPSLNDKEELQYLPEGESFFVGLSNERLLTLTWNSSVWSLSESLQKEATYTNWADDIERSELQKEMCVYLSKYEQWKWKTGSCGEQQFAFICENDIESSSTFRHTAGTSTIAVVSPSKDTIVLVVVGVFLAIIISP